MTSHYGTEKFDTNNRLTDRTIGALVFPPEMGPFESQNVSNMDSAQTHYYQTREITIFDPQPKKDFATTYQLYYPEKPIPDWERPAAPVLNSVPFKGVSTYTAHYPDKERAPDPIPGEPANYEPAPMIDKTTINMDKYRDPGVVPDPAPPNTRPAAELNPDDLVAFNGILTYRDHFPPKTSVLHKGPPPDRTWSPSKSRITTTTHNHFFVPKELPEKLPPAVIVPGTGPFLGSTTYRDDFVPKDPTAPPTVVFTTKGIQVPHPRLDLGVEKVIVDGVNVIEEDVFHVLISRLQAPPCIGRQVFTTVHDDQTQVTILVLHGESYNASGNELLGQFDIINIPPMPRYVAKIEVTFHLDKNDVLTAEARDIDGPRHKAWRAAGGAIVLRQ